jgi:type IV pilus assembly protein PilF
VKTAILVVAATLLAGCAGKPVEEAARAADPSTESASRQRARTLTELADAYTQRGQYKIALDELRKATAADARYSPAYGVYGRIYMELEEDALAEENFRRALDLDAGDSVARTHYGWFLCTRARYDEGLAQFDAALRNPLYTRPEQALASAGLCADRRGDLALAESSLGKSLRLKPDNAAVVLTLAGVNFRQGKLADAQRLLARYTELAPPTAESLWLTVRIERKLGDRSQEATAGSQLRKNFPDSNEARLLQTGQYE